MKKPLSLLKTTTIDNSPRVPVLILNSYLGARTSIITDSSGLDDRFFYFNYGENTEAHGSCGLTWSNQFYMFGGSFYGTQISQIINCELKRVGKLPFDFQSGACSNVANKKFYLCFDEKDDRQCYEATSPTGEFTAISKSINDHGRTKIGASDGNTFQLDFFVLFSVELLAVGGKSPDNNSYEILNVFRNTWSSIENYPFD